MPQYILEWGVKKKKENNPSAGSQRGRAERRGAVAPPVSTEAEDGPHHSSISRRVKSRRSEERYQSLNPSVARGRESRRDFFTFCDVKLDWVLFSWQQVRGKALIIKMEGEG